MSEVKHFSAGTVEQTQSKLVSLTTESVTETEICLVPAHRSLLWKHGLCLIIWLLVSAGKCSLQQVIFRKRKPFCNLMLF